jgi:hypothetical protein
VTDSDDVFFSDFPAKTANSVFIAHGTAKGRIALKTDGVRLYVVVEGEPRGEYLLRCFREGLDKKLIRPNMRTLVDMRRLVGGADWSAVFTLRTYAPWGHRPDGVSATAYLLRNDMFAPSSRLRKPCSSTPTTVPFTSPPRPSPG